MLKNRYECMKGKSLAFLIVVLSAISPAFAWDNKTTHRDLSNVAAERSVLGKGYLRNVLGIEGALDARVHWEGGKLGKDRRIRQWLQDGGEFEDDSGRFFNHFHNPLRPHPWSDAGLNDSIIFIRDERGAWTLWGF
ncbi:MAG: hypothetical protein ACE5GK_10830 [Nitrospiria bacterium]